jgi:flagellar biosynthetic protein FliQ
MESLDPKITELARDFLVTVLIVAGPAMLAGLVIGVAVSLFQALTSVQEQTLTLIPKMLAVFGVTLLLLGPALGVLRAYAQRVLDQLVSFGLS